MSFILLIAGALLPAAARAAAGCDNGVLINGTACRTPNDPYQFRCKPGSTPGHSQWAQENCPSGQHCIGTACQGGTPPPAGAGCDNGVPINGTACRTPNDPYQFRCRAGSTPGHSQWTQENCASGQHCIGAACRAGGAPPPPPPPPPKGAFVTRSGKEFYVGGQRLRFVGVNIAGLAHYGQAPRHQTTQDQGRKDLDDAQRMGARVIRVFAAGNDASGDAVATRLQWVLDQASARGMYVIAALTNVYNDNPFYVKADNPTYYTVGDCGDSRYGGMLSRAFYTGGYKTNYLPWVRTMVTRYRNHPALFAWELGNELICNSNHGAVISFASDVSRTIRGLDPKHLITTGLITSAWMSAAEARQLYSLSTIDFLTYHHYNGFNQDNGTNNAGFEYGIANAVNKPLIVEESGFEKRFGDRPHNIDADLRAHVDQRGARGYMQWGFEPYSPEDGDNRVGMDRGFGDYDGLFSTYQQAAARIK